jgi:hypothetical protein
MPVLPLSQVLNNSDLFWSRDSSIGTSKIGPFPDGPTDRYVIAGDWVANRLRAALTQDNGVTWAEQNAAGAPAIGDDGGGSPAPHTFRVFGACHDTVNRIIYAVFWSTGYKIAVKPFVISTKTWGATVTSAVDLVFTDTMDEANLCCEYTPTGGGRVEILFNRLDANGVDRRTKVYGFAYSVGGGFSGVGNAVGVDGDGYNYRLGTMARDPVSGAIGVNATRELKVGVDPTTGALWMRISAGAYGPVQVVAGGISCNLICQIVVNSAGVAGFVYLDGPRGIDGRLAMHVVRAPFGVAPTWEDLTPAPMQILAAMGVLLYQVQSFLTILRRTGRALRISLEMLHSQVPAGWFPART